MDRLDRRFHGLGRFLVTLGILLLALRLLHLAVPIFYPEVLAGPFSLQSLEEAEALTGFAPLTPSYHPRELGGEPVHVTARRRPPEVVVFWQGERFLRLEQRKTKNGGHNTDFGRRTWVTNAWTRNRYCVPRFSRMPGREIGIVSPVFPPVFQWQQRGDVHHLQSWHDGVQVELTSDLPQLDVERILATLHPVRRQRP